MPRLPSQMELDLTEHLPAAARYARKLCRGNNAEHEDVLQSAVLKVVRFYDTRPDPNGNFLGWFLHIVHNEYVDEARRISRLARDSDIIELHDAARPTPICDQETHRLVTEVEACLRALPPSVAMVIPIATDHRPYLDVAAEHQVPVGTVRSRFARLRQRMREEFA